MENYIFPSYITTSFSLPHIQLVCSLSWVHSLFTSFSVLHNRELYRDPYKYWNEYQMTLRELSIIWKTNKHKINNNIDSCHVIMINIVIILLLWKCAIRGVFNASRKMANKYKTERTKQPTKVETHTYTHIHTQRHYCITTIGLNLQPMVDTTNWPIYHKQSNQTTTNWQFRQ